MSAKFSTLDFLQFLDLQKKLATVEADNRAIRDEFNVQRAKLKELFLQKEGSIQK